MQLPILDWRFVVAVTLLMASFSVSADTRVAQVWTCTLNEGKTLEDLNTVHSKWQVAGLGEYTILRRRYSGFHCRADGLGQARCGFDYRFLP